MYCCIHKLSFGFKIDHCSTHNSFPFACLDSSLFQILWNLAHKLIEVKIAAPEDQPSSLALGASTSPVDPISVVADLPSFIPWKTLPVEEKKLWHTKLHSQLRAMVNTLSLPSPDKVALGDNCYKDLFIKCVPLEIYFLMCFMIF